jgi:hypothetical protein
MNDIGFALALALNCAVSLRRGPTYTHPCGDQHVSPRERVKVIRCIRRNPQLTWLLVQTPRGIGWIEDSCAQQLRLKGLK